MTKRIIVIEDSMTFCERICNMLKRQGVGDVQSL